MTHPGIAGVGYHESLGMRGGRRKVAKKTKPRRRKGFNEDRNAIFDFIREVGIRHVNGRHYCGYLTASNHYYTELANKLIAYTERHPKDAPRVLSEILRFVENLPSNRQNALNRGETKLVDHEGTIIRDYTSDFDRIQKLERALQHARDREMIENNKKERGEI